jgi:hypothetical protein
MNPRPVIFLSAVSKELRTARGHAARLLHSMGYDPKDQDMARTEHGSLRNVLRKWIDQSEGVIQLVGKCYGAEPRDADGVTPKPDAEFDRCSYTQFEALYALKKKKPVWYFFVSDDFPRDTHDPEPDDLAALQRAYRERIIAANDLRHYFATDAELENGIHRIEDRLDDLRRAWQEEQRRVRRSRVFVAVALILILAVALAGVQLGWWVKKETARVKKDTAEIRTVAGEMKDTTTRTEQKVDALLASMREFPGVLSKTGTPGKPEDETARLAVAYTELEKKHGLAPGTLARELPRFAEQLLARADTSALDRASALFATKKFAEAEAAALAAKDKALAAAGQPVRDAIVALRLAGDAAREQIHYPQALAHYRAAAALTDEKRDAIEWADVQHMIAVVLDDDGKSAEAEAILKRVVAVRNRAQGAEHPDTLGSRNNLAVALHSEGKYVEAETEYRAVLPLMERVLGAEHPTTMMSRDNLAVVLEAEGEYAKAEAEHCAVLATRTRVLGAEHPDTLVSRNNLANALDDQGKHAEAEAEHRAVLAIRERVLGAEHPDTLGSRNNLANALRAQGKYPRAEAEHRAVLAVFERVLGAEHPYTLSSRNNLAITLRGQEKYAEAEAEHRAVLAGRQRVLGAEHPDTLDSRNNLAGALRAQGKDAEAEAELRAVLAIRERVLGAKHPDIGHSCYNLALCLEDQKKPKEALPFARRALAIWETTLGGEYPYTERAVALVARLELQSKGVGK